MSRNDLGSSHDERSATCDHCEGMGEVLEPSRTPEEPSRMIPCANCQGSPATTRQEFTRFYHHHWSFGCTWGIVVTNADIQIMLGRHEVGFIWKRAKS